MPLSPEEARELALRELARRTLVQRLQQQRSGADTGAPAGADPLSPSGNVGGRVAPRGGFTGIGENLLTAGTAAVATPVAGLAGLAEMIPGLRQFIPGDSPAEAVESVMSGLTYNPRSKKGKELAQAIEQPAAFIDRQVDRAAEFLSRGNPIAATIIKTTVLGGPAALGLRGFSRRRRAAAQDIRDIEEGARELGIDLGRDIREQIREAGAEASVPARGASMGPVQSELRAAAEAARKERDALYEDARATYADIDRANMRSLDTRLAVALEGYLIEDMKKVGLLLKKLDEIADPGLERPVRLREIEELRRSINRNRPPKADREQNRALTAMQRAMDDFEDDMLNRDLIRGDDTALAAWREARNAARSYRERFTDVRALRQLLEEDTTVEQMRAWVFGASKAGFGPEAGKVIAALKTAIGEDSSAFRGLRSEALYTVMRPLFQTEPNFRQFMRNYDAIVRDNPTIISELSLESMTPMSTLRRIAGAVEETGVAPQINFDIERAMAQAFFGHDIAQAGLKVRIATAMIRILRGSGESERRILLKNLLGYDPTHVAIPKTGAAAASIIVAEIEQSKDRIDDTLGYE